MHILRALVLVATVATTTSLGAAPQLVPPSAEELIQSMRELPAALPGIAPADGVTPPAERRRREIYDQLWALGGTAMPALCRGLSDPDVKIRRNVALFLLVAGGDWYQPERRRLVVEECMPAFVRALADPDDRVRALTAQAVGTTGAAGAPAVPALLRLLGSPSEGDRNTACVGLAGVGAPAKEALPALRRALNDPSADVRHFARRAIERIDR